MLWREVHPAVASLEIQKAAAKCAKTKRGSAGSSLEAPSEEELKDKKKYIARIWRRRPIALDLEGE